MHEVHAYPNCFPPPLYLHPFLFPPLSLQAMADPHPSDTTREEEGVGDMDIPLDQFTFDPHLGVSDGGDETEI